MLSGNSAPCNDPTIGDRSKRPHERLLYAPEDAVSPITDVGIAWTQDPCVPAELCRAAREGPSHFNKLGDVFPFYENQGILEIYYTYSALPHRLTGAADSDHRQRRRRNMC
eukprot:474066-Pelagomonas_calceolata.AAC.1